jgi:hypothetical protein
MSLEKPQSLDWRWSCVVSFCGRMVSGCQVRDRCGE